MRAWMYGVVALGLAGVLTPVWADEAAAPVSTAPAVKDTATPESLTPQIMYEYLVAEVAAQRGQMPLASQAYLKLAQDTADPRIARRALEMALYARQGDAAQSAAKLWLSEEPKSREALHAVIALLLGSKQPSDALPYLHRMLTDHPASVGAEFMQVGDLLSNQPDKAAGYALVKNLAQAYDKLPEAHLVLAQAAARAGHFDDALKELDTASALKPGWDMAAKLRFQVLRQIAPATAEPFVRDYLKQHADEQEVRLVYARFLLDQNRVAESRDQFRILAQALPANPEMQVALGMEAMQLNDLPAADAAFRRALQLNYADAGLLEVYLGQIAEDLHHDDDAANWYLAVTGGPQYVVAQIRYAALLARQGKLDAAREWLHAVKTESDAERVQLIRAEAQLLHEAGQNEAGYALLGEALATRPDSVDLLYDHAMLAEPLGHMDVLEKDLRHLLKLQPDHAQALNALGYTMADHNVHLDEALSLLQQALKLDPDDAFILDSMGWAQYRVGHLPQAESYLSRAYETSKDPEIAAHLGEVLWKQGKFDAARQLWKDALSAHPDNAVLKTAAEKFK